MIRDDDNSYKEEEFDRPLIYFGGGGGPVVLTAEELVFFYYQSVPQMNLFCMWQNNYGKIYLHSQKCDREWPCKIQDEPLTM